MSSEQSAIPNVNVSLETHLILALEPLLPITDTALSTQLAQYLSGPEGIIPYNILLSVSRWSRSPAGSSALRACSLPLDPNSYLMISLLAGTTTSPDRKFGLYEPQEPEQLAAQTKRERKAITTIINGVFSVIGSGAAAWIGSERTNWRQEWRILFALFVAVVVAISETVLYIIWQSRSSSAKTTKMRRLIRAKKEDKENSDHLNTNTTNEEAHHNGLRLRVQTKSTT
ncbi:hypothetical protein J3R30DRAFT_3338336 [Lentinula aciculospora]|uniref:Uncharacterized protein n=1 Tax=Lentinula aciculospora TaxID=153920 RepID=A0A9W9A4X2_9AGAR|nr:hypothetical protein J3R30DRAFT_3338336 [Lentinula aciculospora]